MEFHQAINDALGVAPLPEEITPGRIVRFGTNGNARDDAGWALLFLDGEGGVFGCHRQGISRIWQAHTPETAEERKAFSEKVRQAREFAKFQEDERRKVCRENAVKIWENAKPATDGHSYLARKGVHSHGLRLAVDGRLIIPVRDTDGTLHGLQFIGCNGEKLFLSGTAKKSCYHSIGEPFRKLCVCEGYATGATLHEVTGWAVVIAFDAGNLKTVAEALWIKYPDMEIVVCADDDHATEGNPGLTKAIEAARAVGAKLAIPKFSADRGPKDTDFNDLMCLSGAEAVKDCIESAAIPETLPVTEILQDASSRICVIEALDFMVMQFPPRSNILTPWLPRQGLVMVYGPRGIGKTHVSLGVAYAVASGGTLFGWQAPKPVGVLFLDGEMPAGVLQERIARIAVSSDREPNAPLKIVTPDLQPCGMIDLARPEGQRALSPYLDGIGLIIVDNLSSLCRTGKENEGEAWLPVQDWALQQRAAGRSVVFFHHAGKSGEQRGTSRREDVLDTVIALKRPGDYAPDKGACFEIHFEKARGIYGDDTKPFEVQLITTPEGRQEWVTKPLEQSTAEKVAALLNEGIAQAEIPELLGLSKGAVSKAKKRASEEGLLKVA